jgi:transcriptional regulator with XRE-family HTH domain
MMIWTAQMALKFSHRLAAIRKDKRISQQSLADEIGLHVTQLRRYEAGTSQPTAEVLVRLARALHVSADSLLFDPDERGPDDEFKMHFEAISQMTSEERKIVKAVLEGLIIKHDTQKWEHAEIAK